jgi:hypothetical protein
MSDEIEDKKTSDFSTREIIGFSALLLCSLIGALWLTLRIILPVGEFILVGAFGDEPEKPERRYMGKAGYLQLRCDENPKRDNANKREFFCEYLVPASFPNSADQ